MSKIMLSVAVCLMVAGTAMAQSGSIEIKDVWARATPAKAEVAGAYLTIESATPDRLTGASTPIAKNAQLHKMTMDGNVMRMRQAADIDLPPGTAVTLRPGAFHIMLLGLKHPLRMGDKFPLTLQFAKAGARQVDVTVEAVGAMGPNDQSGGGMSMPMSAPMHH